jgi:hypothetical protein
MLTVSVQKALTWDGHELHIHNLYRLGRAGLGAIAASLAQ